ncbi:probable Actin-related protein 4 [Melanopsichium pennsylvanicum]|uniref:Related to ACT1-actin n=2 Tax=Melanopsichium pennsylvanicum TaxID=63383 RepID=A0A077R8P1_9BASI|nr:related to ACT1-actin [Melanopsichium pennsylvanicum 4]SNX86791.1 probable Actin-related protein 4 [Melanopsichium pennsylvanicum]
MPGVYGGDEINALVIDAGHSSSRVGWAGEDAPRVVVPSYYGSTPITDEDIASLESQASFLSSAAGSTSAAPSVDGDIAMAQGAAQGQSAQASTSATEEASDLRLRSSRAKSASKTLRFNIDRTSKRRRYVGDNDLNLYRPNLDINPIFDDDGILSDSSAFAQLCSFGLDALSANPQEHPLLLTEPAWNARESREKFTELAFETLGTPAFYLANRSVLSSFAAGKPTSLVIDVGSTSVSTTPIVDGFILRKGIHRHNNGGDTINRALLYSLHHTRGDGFAGVTPQYLIKGRSSVDPGVPASVVLRQDRVELASASFKQYHVNRVVNDFKESVAQVLETPWDEQQAQFRSGRMYEFPDGYNDAFGIERFKASEVLFTPSLWNGISSLESFGAVLHSSSNPTSMASEATSNNDVSTTTTAMAAGGKASSGLADMVLSSINSVDVDSRPSLFANIVLVGGSSLIPGLSDRLSYELGVKAPNQKVKIHSPGNTTERRHSSWLGASILASLGTFHQLWISKQEYEEHGSAIVHARCK